MQPMVRETSASQGQAACFSWRFMTFAHNPTFILANLHRHSQAHSRLYQPLPLLATSLTQMPTATPALKYTRNNAYQYSRLHFHQHLCRPIPAPAPAPLNSPSHVPTPTPALKYTRTNAYPYQHLHRHSHTYKHTHLHLCQPMLELMAPEAPLARRVYMMRPDCPASFAVLEKELFMCMTNVVHWPLSHHSRDTIASHSDIPLL